MAETICEVQLKRVIHRIIPRAHYKPHGRMLSRKAYAQLLKKRPGRLVYVNTAEADADCSDAYLQVIIQRDGYIHVDHFLIDRNGRWWEIRRSHDPGKTRPDQCWTLEEYHPSKARVALVSEHLKEMFR